MAIAKEECAVDKADEKVVIELTSREALVLFDLLSRWGETDESNVLLEHQAEQRVLWDMLSMLESKLIEPFAPDYHERLNKAREMVQDARE
jgi:hypothetical protein